MRSRRNFARKARMNVIHFRALTHRYFELIYNDKLSFILLLLQAPLMLAVIAVACASGSFSKDFTSAQTGIFVLITICSVMGILNSYREVCKERDVLIREYATGLDATAYVMSKLAVQAVICLLHAVILCAGSWFILKLPLGVWYRTIPNFFFIVYLSLLSSSAMGILISCLLKNSESAILPILFIIMGQIVLSDTMIPIPDKAAFITFPIIAKWGVAGLGSVFNITGLHFPNVPQELIPSVYTVRLSSCYLALLIILILSAALSIFFVRRILKTNRK